MSKLLNILNNDSETIVGTSQNGLVEPNGILYHVIQQTDNRTNLFSLEAAKHRDWLIKNACPEYEILPVINVIMPTHTHDVFLTNDVKKISAMLKNVNRGTAVFIRKERELKYKQKTQEVFAKYPGFVAIKNRLQFICLIKYLYDNPAYLKASGDFVPYSCFDAWEKGYFKPYNMQVFNQILNKDIAEILPLCKKMNKEQFREYAEKEYGHDSDDVSNEMFMINPSLGWLK